ncbi:helix-turn-helix domain-containing protein [Bacillaceae bacterium W0354]
MKEVADRVKSIRKLKEMTLKDLSEATGLSTGFLSQVESGSSNLAISSLKKIADAFEVNISEFFQDRHHYNYVTKKDEQKIFQVDGLDTVYANLGGNFDKRVLAPYILILGPKQGRKDTFKFSGEEFYYVLKGGVKFTIDNKEYCIYEGDSIHFPSHLEHYGENLMDDETHLLGVITPVVF